MENQNTNYIQKPIYDGLLPQQEYDAVLVKATVQEPRPNMPQSVRVMFKIDFPETVAFVSGFMNLNFKSGDKTATWLKNLGITATNGVVPVEQLKGKRCKLYVTPGKKVWSANLNKEIQYHKIAALTPANSVIPQAIKPAPVQQPVQAMPTQVPVQPTVQPMTQPVQNNPFVAQAVPAAQPVYATPQVAPVQQQPVQPQQYQVPQGNSMAAQLAKLSQPQQVPVQPTQASVQVAPVQQPVAQPLPTTPDVSLDF